MRNVLQHWFTKSAFSLGIALAGTAVASAQATLAAQRGAELAPFVQTTMVSPDWGPTYNLGFTAGLDYTRYIHSIVQPSLEVRFNDAPGSTVSEHSFVGGLKLAIPFGRIIPYGTMLAGNGTITFAHPSGNYLSDNSFIYALGGGADIAVLPQWKVRLDYSAQTWNVGQNGLTPRAFSLGVSYVIPFRGSGWAK